MNRYQGNKKHLIESQRVSPIGQTGFATGHTFGKNENIDKPARGKQVVVNITPELNFYTSTYFVGTDPATLFGKNSKRRYLLIQNVGATTVFIGFGATPTLNGNNGVELPAGVQYSFEAGFVPSNDAVAICATSGKLIIVEGIMV